MKEGGHVLFKGIFQHSLGETDLNNKRPKPGQPSTQVYSATATQIFQILGKYFLTK
jgi:hypothetical protein